MFDLRKTTMLIPFGYTAATRTKSARDWLYLFASQWGLGLLVLFILGGEDYALLLLTFVLGYVAFISIYEVGYLVNDVWDAKRSNDGRGRLEGNVTTAFYTSFLAIRIGVWVFLTSFFLRGDTELWFASSIALVVVFSAHNLLKSPDSRYSTFCQLALMRFSLPLVFSLPKDAFEQIIIVAFLHYLYFRGLAYLDSKSLLAMPHRKEPDFGFRHTIMMLPIVTCLYLATDSILFPAAWSYTAISYLLFLFWSKNLK